MDQKQSTDRESHLFIDWSEYEVGIEQNFSFYNIEDSFIPKDYNSVFYPEITGNVGVTLRQHEVFLH